MKENEIRDAVDKIEPKAGAKERMYQNILKKAEEAKQTQSLAERPVPKKKENKIVPMRFIKAFVPVAACLCIAVLGVMHFLPSENPGIDPAPNPPMVGDTSYTIAESPEAFQQIGITLDAPEGAENISYAIFDENIASVNFEMGNHAYFIVASAQSGDFSGLHGDVIGSEQIDSKSSAILYEIECEPTSMFKASWTDGKIHYYLGNTDGADKEDFKSICMELIRQTIK